MWVKAQNGSYHNFDRAKHVHVVANEPTPLEADPAIYRLEMVTDEGTIKLAEELTRSQVNRLLTMLFYEVQLKYGYIDLAA